MNQPFALIFGLESVIEHRIKNSTARPTHLTCVHCYRTLPRPGLRQIIIPTKLNICNRVDVVRLSAIVLAVTDTVRMGVTDESQAQGSISAHNSAVRRVIKHTGPRCEVPTWDVTNPLLTTSSCIGKSQPPLAPTGTTTISRGF